MQWVIGIDEVGRGCLAGPITVAAVAARRSVKKFLRGIKDSKKLSPKQREEWYKFFLSLATRQQLLSYAVSSVGQATIDRIGISRTAKLAVGRCLRKLKVKSERSKVAFSMPCVKIVLDGSLYAPRTYQNQDTIIKGDEQIPLIAAASIVAKVTRDSTMTRLHNHFPLYGFSAHKGYGTKIHRAAIAQHGLCAL